MRLVLLKAIKIANQAGYYLLNGRWHAVEKGQPLPAGAHKAPKAAHPHAAGKPVVKETIAPHEWDLLKLPDTNTNAPVFNKQLEQLKAAADKGDVTGILASGYNTNTYGKKLAIIANHVLDLLGSDHKVAAGQKPGDHPAVQTAPEIEAGEKPIANAGEAKANTPEQATTTPADQPAKSVSAETVPAPSDKGEASQSGSDQALADFQAKHKKMGTPTIKYKGKDWYILSTGAEKGDKVVTHLASTTEGTTQKNGFYPKQMVEELDKGEVDAAIGKSNSKTAKPESSGLSMPEFEEGKQTKGVKDYYEKTAKKIMAAAESGDVAALNAMPTDKGNTWKGKTANSKKLMALHKQAIAHVEAQKGTGKYVQYPDAAKQATNEKSIKDAIADAGSLSAAQHLAEQYVSKHSGTAKGNAYDEAIGALSASGYSAGLLHDWKKQDFADGKLGDYQLDEKDPLLSSIKAAKTKAKVEQILNGMIVASGGGVEPIDMAIDYLKKTGHDDLVDKYEKMKPAQQEANSTGPKLSNLGVLLNDAGYPKTFANKTQAQNAADKLTAQGYKAHVTMHPFKVKVELDETGEQPRATAKDAGPKEGDTKEGADGTLVLKDGHWVKMNKDQPKAEEAKQAEIPADLHGKLAMIPWDTHQIGGDNTNAKSHNAQVQKIKALAEAGDVAGLQAIYDKKKGSKQTYTKKQALLAQIALAAIAESPSVSAQEAKPQAGGKPVAPKFTDTTLASLVPDVEALVNDGSAQSLEWLESEADSAKEIGGAKDASAEDKAYAKYVQDALAYAKAQSGAKAGQAESTDKPVPPAVKGNNWKKEIGSITEAMEAGNHKYLQYMLNATDGIMTDDADAANKYAQAALDYLQKQGKYEPPKENAKPEMPNLSFHNGAAKVIEQALNEANEPKLQSLVESTASMDSTNGKILHKYAIDALNYVQNNKLDSADHNGKSSSGTPKPTAPDLASMVWQTEASIVTEAMDKGDAKKLNDMIAMTNSLVSHAAVAVNEYAKQALAYVESQQGDADDGPHDGDTKQGADGMLVFKNGRWHKMGDEQAAADKPAPAGPADVEIPSFDGPNKYHNELLAKAAAALKEKITAEGKAGFKGVVTNHKTGAVTVKIDGVTIKNATVGSKNPVVAQMAKFVDELKASVADKKKTVAKPKPKVAKVAEPAPEPAKEIESMDHWTQTGGQGGSNPGGKFKDANGVEWYCKFPGDDDVAKAEVLAAKLYGALGLQAQDAKLITKDGKIGIASRWVDVEKTTADKLASTPGVLEGFAADAWLANWDVVGLGYDNLQVDGKGHAMRVDAGGSLMYRAQGSKKAFGNAVTELDSMRDPKINPQAAAVFGKMTDADIAASVAKVAQISDAKIRMLVNTSGYGTKDDRKALAETLIARKNDLIAKYPKAAKVPKKRLDPNNLPVKPEELPKRHDFANWNGNNSPLSSKAHVNESNQKAEDEMLAIAKTGNLTKLKEYKFQPVDKETGAPVGEPKPISEHPSKHVVQYHSDLVQMLDEIANPPQPLKIFQESDVNTLEELDAAFPPKPFGTTVNSVSSNEKMGFWVVLGGIHGVENLTPKKVMNYSTQAIESAYTKFKEASKLAKHFVKSVQASGSYNDLFRDGKTHDLQGNKLSDVAQAALEFATEQPEGTSLYRWQNMSDDMVKKILSTPEGTVFQATGPMCTSYSPTATSGFGKHRVTVRYAKGAKGVESFGSGNYQGEKEVTTLPNSRFVILKREMVQDEKKGGQRLELEVLMLPPDIGV